MKKFLSCTFVLCGILAAVGQFSSNEAQAQSSASVSGQVAAQAVARSCEDRNRTHYTDALRCRKTTYLANGIKIWIDYETGCEFFWSEYYDGLSTRTGPGAPRPANGSGEQLCRNMRPGR